jgi:2-phosphosulfolactate phosphatase
LEVLFTPTDYEAIGTQYPTDAVCVVFDVLRATSTMVTALFHGALYIKPAESIAEAVRLKHLKPDCLLAGERNGVRIRSESTGGIDFDLGNSPREFTPPVVKGRGIVMTTTNGTRALRACRGASTTLICSFLNLNATAAFLSGSNTKPVFLICSGTGENVAYEDVLCAGALIELTSTGLTAPLSDSALMAQRLYKSEEPDLEKGLGRSTNGRRVMSLSDLRDDLEFCAKRDCFPIVAGTRGDAPIALIPG